MATTLVRTKADRAAVQRGQEIHNRLSDRWGVVVGWQEILGDRIGYHVRPLGSARDTWWTASSIDAVREGEG